MQNNHKKATVGFKAPEPSHELARKIIDRIERRERRLLSAKIAGFGMCVAASFSLAGFGLVNAITELFHSGFFSFISLAFSDFSAAFGNWSDFLFSVVESVPVFPVALFFGGLAFLLWSTAHFAREFGIRVRTHQFSISS